MKLTGPAAAAAMAAAIMAACSGGNAPSDDAAPVPRPKAWPRTALYDTVYVPAAPGSDIVVNAGAVATADDGRLTAIYPAYHAALYLTDTRASSADEADRAVSNRLERISLNINGLPTEERTLAPSRPDGYQATVFVTPHGSLTPLQFVARRGTRVVSGALVMDRLPVSADSLAPTVKAVEADIIRLITSLR